MLEDPSTMFRGHIPSRALESDMRSTRYVVMEMATDMSDRGWPQYTPLKDVERHPAVPE